MTYLCTPVLLLLITITTFTYSAKTRQPLNNPDDSSLDFTGLARKYGYRTQEYKVTTRDGYILKLYRLKSNRCLKLRKPPVFLMHGLLLSSDSWLDSGPNASLAYQLADECYDMWLGNIRGNYNGRWHVTLNPDRDPQFWNYCVDDNGYYDIPAQIDTILQVTNAQFVNYIGFSQGCAELAIACSERPEYCNKVQLFIALAPAVKMTNTRSVLFRAISQSVALLDPLLTELGIYELTVKGGVLQQVLDMICKNSVNIPICQGVLDVFDSMHAGSIARRTLRRLYAHFPAGSSRKTFLKYAQSFNSDYFGKFDYGSKKNLQVYGTAVPPRFNLKRLRCPTVIIHGSNDFIVDIKDVHWLQNELAHVLEFKIVDSPFWNHFDVLYSKFSPTLLFPTVNNHLARYSYYH